MSDELTDKELVNAEDASSYVDFISKFRKMKITTTRKEPNKKGGEVKSNFVGRSD